MKTFLILGAGTAGTMVAHRMSRHLDPRDWRILLVDEEARHYYQPGFLFVPFEVYRPQDVIKPRREFVPQGVELILSRVELIEPEKNRVRLAEGRRALDYDVLVIATGSHIRPEETPGLLDDGWRRNVTDFYTLEGATALRDMLRSWEGGRLVMNVVEMPIKCPVAPLEFLFLADWFFHERGLRDAVELTLATPLPGAFTKPKASALLGDLLDRKRIHVERDFNVMEVDHARSVIRSYDEREVAFDLLVTIPTNMGAEVIERSGMGDELNFVPTDKHTLQSKKWENVWAIGDAAGVPASKAGSVAHYMLDVLVENILRQMAGLEPLPKYDGHVNCFIETGFGKGVLIDFNYEVEPLPGRFPVPGLGPFTLLEESSFNHWGKMAFRWVYWNVLLKGRELPFGSQMSMAGKWN